MMHEKLICPKHANLATQCRAMGIGVGDTIIGREVGSREWWSESRLTLIFLGEQECVFTEMRRNNEQPFWVSNGEAVNWTLGCREWFKCEGPIA